MDGVDYGVLLGFNGLMAGDHPGIPYLEALKTNGAPMYTKGRPDGPPLWIVIHDMEEEELPDMAERVAQYFHTGAGGRSVSSHYTADSNSIIQCVLLANSAWTVGNRQGNNRGINWELTGFGSQTREQWLDPYGRAMFALIAPIIRADAAKYGIPLRTLTDDQVRAYQPGITSHWQLGRVFGGTDHQDPGPNFPWDYLMQLLAGGNMAGRLFLVDDSTQGVYENITTDPKTGRGVLVGVAKSAYMDLVVQSGAGVMAHIGSADPDYWMVVKEWPQVDCNCSGSGGSTDLTPVLEAIEEVEDKVDALTPEIRDAVADLGEGGAKQVRADADK